MQSDTAPFAVGLGSNSGIKNIFDNAVRNTTAIIFNNNNLSLPRMATTYMNHGVNN